MGTTILLILLALALGAAILQTVRLRAARSAPPTDPLPGPIDRSDEPDITELSKQGVIILGPSLVPVMANPAAAELLGMPPGALPPRLHSDELLSIARRAISRNLEVTATVTLWPSRREAGVRALPLKDSEGVVLFLDDVTDEMNTQRIRRQFVASASHELKTPVAGLQALAEAIEKAVVDDPEAAERLSRRLVSESERMGRLVNDLLDLSRLEDPASISTRSIELADVVDRQVDEMQPLAKTRGIDLSTEISTPLWVKGDDGQLGLMIRNLLDNAVRYTPDGGSISVGLQADSGNAILTVTDTGIGIPLRAQARVFERFYRVDKDRARGSGGTGLGLSIVKHVADLHGGHVSLESELGEGSTFTVRLPIAEPPVDRSA